MADALLRVSSVCCISIYRKRLLARFRELPFRRVIADAALAILDYVRHLRTIREELGANATNHPIFDAEDDPQYYYYTG